MAMKYQSSASNRKFEVVGARQLAVHLPLPLVELWEDLQPQVEHLAGLAGLQDHPGSDRRGSDTARGTTLPAGPGFELRALGAATGLCRVCRAESGGGTSPSARADSTWSRVARAYASSSGAPDSFVGANR